MGTGFYKSPMKNAQIIVLSLFLLLLTIISFSSISHAQDENLSSSEDSASSSAISTSASDSNADESNNSYQVALKTTNFLFEEPELMQDHGQLSGVAIAFSHRMSEESLLGFQGEYISGQTSYDGSLMDDGERLTAKDNYRIYALEGMWIRNSMVPEMFKISPFLGLGYRNTFDGKDNDYDYRRENVYVYGIAGAEIELAESRGILLLAKGQFNFLVGGQNKSYMTDAYDSDVYPDVELKFKSGQAFKLGLEMHYTLPNKNKLQADVSWTEWRVGDSETFQVAENKYLVEPNSKTTLTSLSLGYIF